MATHVDSESRHDRTPTGRAAAEDAGTYESAASFAQQRLWLIDRLQPGSAVYNIALVADVFGPLNIVALEASFGEVVQRHDGLRTSFRVSGGRPLQVVHRRLRASVQVIDLRGLASPGQGAVADGVLRALTSRPFDLERPPLFALSVLSLDARTHVLALCVHHAIFDQWSEEIVVGELARLYDACVRGGPARLTPPSLQYPAFAERQRQMLEGPALDRLIDFWRGQLGSPERFAAEALPFRRGADLEMRSSGKTLSARLTGDQVTVLRRLTRTWGRSLFAVTLGVFMVTVHRYARARNVLVTVPVSSRESAETEGIVGQLINLLPVSVEIDERESLSATLDRVWASFLAARDHQDLPFEKIVELLGAQRSFGGTWLSRIVFGYRRKGQRSIETGGLTIAPREMTGEHARFELSVFIDEREHDLDVAIEFNEACFDEADIQRLFTTYLTAIAQLPLWCDAPLMDLPLVGEAERALQLREWNGQDDETSSLTGDASVAGAGANAGVGAGAWDDGVVGAIERTAAAQPDAIAVRGGAESGGAEVVTYGALLARSARLAAWLAKQGAGPEHLVGVAVERTASTVAALLGVLRSGAAYVAIDAAAPPERVRALLTEAGTRWLVTAGPNGRALGTQMTDAVTALDSETLASGPTVAGPWRWRRRPIIAETLAYVLFTSGSTGRPKGVMVSHGNLAASTWTRQQYYGGPPPNFLLLSPFFFDSSVAGLFWTLRQGGCLVIPGDDDVREPARLVALSDEAATSHVLGIPSLYAALLQAGGRWPVAIVAGEACPVSLVTAHRQHSGGALFNEYGPTEGTVWSTVWRLDATASTHASDAGVPIGRAVGMMRAYVSDARGHLLPVGADGEIVLGGAGVARGYWRQPAATAERFVPDGWATRAGARGYRTGDGGRWRVDGALLFTGRGDDEVKLRGHRLHLGEVASLLRQHPEVADAAAIVRDAATAPQLIAFVVPAGGAPAITAPATAAPPVTGTALRDYLRMRLPPAIVPARVHVVDTLPRLPNGKLDRLRLLDVVARDEAASGHESILDPVEALVADVWKEILARKSIAPDDDFFEIGGHSLLATQVLSRIRRQFEFSVPLRTFFDQPTVRALASHIKRAQRASAVHEEPPDVQPRAVRERAPLSFQQQRLWSLYEADRSSPDYHLPRAVRIRGPLAIDVLGRVFDEIVRRHEILRTAFVTHDGQPIMVAHVPPRDLLSTREIPGTTAAQRLAAIARDIDDEVRRPFVLEESAVRFILYRVDDDDHVLFTNVHHIVTDGWSLGVLTREIRTLYAAFRAGRESPLPALPFQYGDFAAWQRDWLRGSRLDRYIDAWEQELAGVSPSTLPVRRCDTRDTRELFAGRALHFTADANVAAGLRVLCRETGSTLYMALQSLFAVSAGWHSGTGDIVIGTSVANRGDARTEPLIGFFANTLPMRTVFDEEATCRSLMPRARRAALKALALEDAPIEAIAARLRRTGALRPDAALFDTFFVLHNEPIQPLVLDGLRTEPFDIHHPTTMFALAASATEREDGLAYMLHYDANILTEDTVRGVAGTFERLMRAAASTPDERIVDTLAMPASALVEMPLAGADDAVEGAAEIGH